MVQVSRGFASIARLGNVTLVPQAKLWEGVVAEDVPVVRARGTAWTAIWWSTDGWHRMARITDCP